jgi:hypothetical protein
MRHCIVGDLSRGLPAALRGLGRTAKRCWSLGSRRNKSSKGAIMLSDQLAIQGLWRVVSCVARGGPVGSATPTTSSTATGSSRRQPGQTDCPVSRKWRRLGDLRTRSDGSAEAIRHDVGKPSRPEKRLAALIVALLGHYRFRIFNFELRPSDSLFQFSLPPRTKRLHCSPGGLIRA